jgi:NSS family neurotransmitter:Na+ symporter
MVPPSPGGYWHRNSGFVVASVLALVGAGVVLRLPQLAMQHGGGAFLCAYLAFLVLVAWPLLTTEWLFGRVVRQDLAGALYADIASRDASRIWMLIAGLMLLVPLVVASYYAVIAGWNVAFLLRAVSGALAGADPENPSVPFLSVAQDAERSLAWFTISVVGCGVIAARGIRGGVEACARGLLWGVLLLLALLALAVARGGDWSAAMEPWSGWDWRALGWRGTLEALRQALYSAGLGLGMMVAYAGYLPERARVLRSAALVLALSTVLALLGGSLVMGLLADAPQRLQGQMPALFVAPVVMAVEHGWRVVPASIYLLVVALGVASIVALMEPLVQFVMARKGCTRVFAVTAVGFAVWCLGLLTVLTFGSTALGEVGGRSAFGWLQLFALRLGAPLAVLMLLIYVGRVWSRAELDAALRGRQGPGDPLRVSGRANFVRFMLVYPTRVAVIAAMLYGLGLVDLFIRFWSPN